MNEPDPKTEQGRPRSRRCREKVRIRVSPAKRVRRWAKKAYERWKYYLVLAGACIAMAIMIWLLLGKLIKPPPME